MAALIAGMAGCDPIQYNLTVSSTEGGEVIEPGEGTFAYDEGTIVDLVAEADEGYQFVNWTGNVSAIADVNADATTITVNGDYSITANFEELDPGTLFAGGNGTEEDPYQIANWHHLHNVRDYLDNHFILINDLHSTTAGYAELASPTANVGKGWEPIGSPDPYDPYRIDLFTGSFDGQGYKIRDLFINRPDESLVGLFGVVGGGHIENIGVVNITVTGEHEVGGLVGHIDDGAVSNSYATGNVTGEGYYVGGLVGCINGASVSNAYSTGSVTGDEWVGGLVGGGAWSTVSNSYSTGNVSGNDDVGGLVGLNFFDLTVSNSFWDIETSGQSTSAGGTGKNTTEMQGIITFSGAAWNITAVALNETNPAYIWNIVNGVTYPFLSWQPI